LRQNLSWYLDRRSARRSHGLTRAGGLQRVASRLARVELRRLGLTVLSPT